jgi:RNA polymerase sigma-70 factor (ECF subfamily)
VQEQSPRFDATRDEHERAVRAFAHAVADGDLDGLVSALDPDVVWTADGGGHAVAALKPIRGADRVARGWMALRRKPAIVPTPRVVEINDRPGLMIVGTDGYRSMLSFTVERGRITRIDVVRNPEKLRHVREFA